MSSIHPILLSKINHNLLWKKYFQEFPNKEVLNEGFTDSIENTINYTKYADLNKIHFADAYVQGIELGRMHKESTLKSMLNSNFFSRLFYRISLYLSSK